MSISNYRESCSMYFVLLPATRFILVYCLYFPVYLLNAISHFKFTSLLECRKNAGEGEEGSNADYFTGLFGRLNEVMHMEMFGQWL